MAEREVEILEGVAAGYDPSDPTMEFDYYLARLNAQAIGPWLKGRRVLEMGCATGELTHLLRPLAQEYVVVEGSAANVEAARARVPDAEYHTGLWEEYDAPTPCSDVVCVFGLEHVEDPVAVLTRASAWLEPGGRMHLVVPNADSLHRHVGVEMGMLGATTELTESDHRLGHRRVYTLESFLDDVRRAGLNAIHWQGVFLKVLSNAQMLEWDWELIQALDRVSRRFPAYGANLYAVAEPASD